tara:strand:+ start:97 stop:219 length:123 start_codon:yes stop_codon:yes gene_type:complete
MDALRAIMLIVRRFVGGLFFAVWVLANHLITPKKEGAKPP